MNIIKILEDIDLRMTNIGYNSLFIGFVPDYVWGRNPRIRLRPNDFYSLEESYYNIVASNKVIFEEQSYGVVSSKNFFRYLKVE